MSQSQPGHGRWGLKSPGLWVNLLPQLLRCGRGQGSNWVGHRHRQQTCHPFWDGGLVESGNHVLSIVQAAGKKSDPQGTAAHRKSMVPSIPST